MESLFPAEIDAYLETLLPERDEVFREMERTAEETGFPHIGPYMGGLLELLARISGARVVFELGSGFGYSAAWFARGLAERGRVILTDLREENRKRALEYFRRLGFEDRCEFRVGDALELLRAEEGPLDIIFCDIQKEAYPDVIEPARERLRPGGLLIADNTLWSGRVARPDPDPETRAVQRYNRILADHPEFHAVLLPLRDGVTVARKR